LLVDEGAGSVNADGKIYPIVDGYFGGYNPDPSKPGVDRPAACHVEGGNFLFCDAHARWIIQKSFLDKKIVSYDPFH
jgi:prepilin-type processing-associated H-X9-DG protein